MSRRRVRDERGQATVEFAIVIPLVMLLILGIIEFSKAFNYWITLNHLSNEGARWAAVDKLPGKNPPYTCGDFKDYLVSQMATGDLQNIIKGNSQADLDQNITLAVAGSGPLGAPQIGDPVTVKIATIAPQKYALASLGESFLPDFGRITLSGTSTMRLEQVPSWTTNSSPC